MDIIILKIYVENVNNNVQVAKHINIALLVKRDFIFFKPVAK
jgi:hypothetical protein